MEFINNSDYLDQHFLKNDDIVLKLIQISNLTKDDIVVEVGPGKGVITNKIASKVKKLYCIELDTRLKPYLDELVNKYNNIEVIYKNILDTDLPKCNKIITALPYSIIEPFIKKMIKTDFQELIMIMGSTYADNIINNKITNLSLMTNCFYDVEKILDITPDNFYPEPRTMSSLIKLVPKEKVNDEYLLFKNMYLLNHKKIKNALLESLINIGICNTKNEAKTIINNINLSNDLLNTKFEVCSNKNLEELYNKVKVLKFR